MNLQFESQLDDISWQILEALQEDARISYSELGRQVGMSPPAVAERVRRMEDMGIITGYRATINLEKVGFPITAFVRINAGEFCARMGNVVQDIPEIIEYHRVTGGDSGIMKIVVSSVAHLEEVINRLASFGTTTTSIVLSNPLKGRVISRDMLYQIEEVTPIHQKLA
jgi:Lrp/AsnC family leucine-responsive transcriptional regulator